MIELSCDLGEAITPAEREAEDPLWDLVDAANIACGGHVGDADSMRRAVRRCSKLASVVGAHPSYPDRENFGRVSLSIPRESLRHSIAQQLSSLREICVSEGVRLTRVKPHGALYNDAHSNWELGEVIVDACLEVDPTLSMVASPQSMLLAAARARSMGVIREAFGDRRYRSDGSLVPRSESSSLLLDFEEAAAQAARLTRDGTVVANDGSEVSIEHDTLCVHGDMPNAAARLRLIRAVLGRS